MPDTDSLMRLAPIRVNVLQPVAIADEGQRLIRFGEQLVREGQRWKEELGLESAILKGLDFLAGRQFDMAPAERAYRARVVANFYRSIVMRELGMLTDTVPIFKVTSRSGNDIAAEVATDVIQAIWRERNGQQFFTHALLQAIVTGVAPCMPIWDKMLDMGWGDIRFALLDNDQCIVDRNLRRADALQDEAQYVIVRIPRPLAQFRLLYPGRGHLVRPDRGLSQFSMGEHASRGSSVYQRPSRASEAHWEDSAIPRAWETRCYFIDYSLHPTKPETDDGRFNFLFPRKRCFVWAGDTLLADGDAINWDGRFPLELMDWGYALDHPYGEGELTSLMPLQVAMNLLLSGIVHNARLHNQPPRFVPEGTMTPDELSELERFGDMPGKTFVTRGPGTVVDRPPQTLPAMVFQTVGMLQKGMEDVSGMIPVAQGQRQGLCVDPQTECLTKRGWKHHDELLSEDELYTFNPETGEGEWSPLLGVTRMEYQGEMYRVETHRVDALCTPNHGWLVGTTNERFHNKAKRRISNKPGKLEWAGKTRYQRVEMQDINTSHYITNTISLNSNYGVTVYHDSFVELVGWVMTEGCYHQLSENSWRIEIAQSTTVHPEHCKRIERCLAALHIQYSINLDKKTKVASYRFYREAARSFIQQFPEKRLTYDFICSLPISQLRILYRAMLWGDGTLYELTGNVKDGDQYRSADEELLNQFQMVAVLVGKATRKVRMSMNEQPHRHRGPRYGFTFRVSCRREAQTKWRTLLQHTTKEDYQGLVWCPTTTTGTWLARRNGVTYLTHNTSGVAIDSLQAAAQVPIRLNSRRAESFLARFGQLVLSRTMQFYSNDRVLYLAEGAKAFAVLQQRDAFLQQLIESPSLEEMERLLQASVRDFQFEVENESGLGIAKTQKVAFAERQQAAGNFSGVEVLKTAGIPNPEEKVAEADAIQQKRAAGMMGLKMLMGGMGGENKPPSGKGPPRAGGQRDASQQHAIEGMKRNGIA